jgi:hypothetical protein
MRVPRFVALFGLEKKQQVVLVEPSIMKVRGQPTCNYVL